MAPLDEIAGGSMKTLIVMAIAALVIVSHDMALEDEIKGEAALTQHWEDIRRAHQ
jgi:hypothetical protein